MPVLVTDTEGDRPLVVLPRAMPVENSRSIRTIDVLDLCRSAKRVPKDNFTDQHRGDSVDIEFAEIKGVKCWYFSFFICGRGSAQILKYPPDGTRSKLASLFREHFQSVLGCDPDELAEAIVQHAPWK